jgi:DeoR/GlpR family transcriptional regulator of sugar metabolism
MSRSRQSQIQALLNKHGECSVEFLARKCNVSDMTIRRDLMVLEKSGGLIRTHGGATPREKVLFEFQFLDRARLNESAKRQIAVTAAKLIKNGQSVMMDSGTTTLAVAKELHNHKQLSLITTSLPIAAILQYVTGINVLLLGGFVRCDAADLCGALTETNLENLRADMALIGADAIDLKGNVYNKSLEVARMLSKMTAAAAVTYVVADSSKIGHSALMKFGSIPKWEGLITDSGVSKQNAAALRQAGVNLIVSEPVK